MDKRLILWDSSAKPSEHAGPVYTWNGYEDRGSIHSLLRYVDTHGERLRRKYLAWVHDLGESLVDGKRLIDHLAIEDGLSYWWMTLFVEQSPWKSPLIVDSIRILAFEEIVVQSRPCKLRLVSNNQGLHEVLSGLCQNLSIAYEWERLPDKPRQQLSLKRAYQALPDFVQALMSLVRYMYIRWPFRGAGKTNWSGGGRNVFFCSYFDNVDPTAADQGVFHSYYWGGLPALLHRVGCQSNWLQLFIPSAVEPTAITAIKWVKRFNQAGQEQGLHSFLEAYLSWRIVLRVLKRWFSLALISWRIRQAKHAFRPLGSQFSLWPLMRRDWQTSMRGAVAVDNLLWLELFDRVMREVPHQEKGLYLCENHAWERALIHAWRKHAHGRLIAVAHSTVRFWDLRYFTDPRTIRSSAQRPMPQPDLVALNGKAAVDAYLGVDFPKETIVECEALRYSYLNGRSGRSSRKAGGEAIKVLVLGDYTPAATKKMLLLLESAVLHVSVLVTYTLKPHPNFMIKAEDYPTLDLKVITAPLGDILQDFDIAYSSNVTSAAVDAYLVGLPVVVVLNETELNFSPLRGRAGVFFVDTPKALAEALHIVSDEGAATETELSDFFFLDPELPRWSRLVAN